jgi:hypothetical protein
MNTHCIFFYIVLALSGMGLVSCSSMERPELLLQEIAVTLHPESHEVSGASKVIMRTGGTTRFSFTLSPDATVESVLVDGRSIPFTFIGGFLSVDLRSRTSGKGSATLEIAYHCGFNDQPPEDAISGEDPTYGINAVVSRKGVFLGPGAGWYPSSAIVPEKRIIRVSAPAGIEAITSGRRIFRGISGNETVSQWEEARPAGDLSLSAGRYRIDESAVDGIPVYTYFTPGNAGLSRRYLDASARYIRFYKGLFGPYPFEKFAVVENFFPTGYGFPSYTLLGSTIIRLPFIPDTSLPHEIAHSWWGNGVLVDNRQGNWSEGLVTYLSDYLLQERKSPESGREYRSIVLSDYASLVTPDRDFPLREFNNRIDPASRSIGYGKGMMVFHMIRRMVGDDIFFRGLREVCSKKLFSRASWGDFLDTYSRLSGKDFSAFRSEWLDRGGGPHLAFSGVSVTGKGRAWTVSGDVTQSQPLYSFPLQLELETSGGVIRQSISMEKPRTRFSFTAKDRPKRLILDPDADLFRILSTEEIPPTINRIKGAHSLVVVVSPDCRAGEKTINLLLESLGQAGATIITEKEAAEGRIAGRDILFCGMPKYRQIAKGLSAGSFTIGKETFRGAGDALFAVTRSPFDRERIAAIFYPLSGKAATDSVPKITHYGKYSFLAFSSGRNIRKGIETVTSGESNIALDME